MFHGTQHVPKQISEKFMSDRLEHAIACRYFIDDTNPAVVAMFEKLTGSNMSQKKVCVLEDKVTGLGNGKPTTLTASQVLAVMQWTSLPVHSRSAIVFHSFVANHQLFTSERYQRATRQNNFAVCVQPQKFNYGNISACMLSSQNVAAVMLNFSIANAPSSTLLL